MKIPLAKPFIPNTVLKEMKSLIKKGFLTEGNYTKAFEKYVKEFINCKYCITFTSATTALEATIRALNLKSTDEIIAPNFSYPATISPALINNIKIKLIDVDINDYNICIKDLENNITKKTKAIIPVSVFGNSLQYDKLLKLRKKYNFKIIEDAAAALGTSYKNIKVGNFADFTIFSFHPRKTITTGEGGIVTTKKKSEAEWLKMFKSFGLMNNKKSKFEIVGSNLKMSNINALFGIKQILIYKKILKQKKNLAKNYIDQLSGCKNIQIQKSTLGSEHSYQTFCITVENRDQIIKKMRKDGIETQIGYYALSEQNAFRNNKNVSFSRTLQNSLFLAKHTLALPLYYEMKVSEQNYVIKSLKKYI